MRSRSFIAIALLFFSLQSFRLSESVTGKSITNFSLRAVDNKDVSLDSYPNAKGFIIIFICNRCPFAKLYTQRLNNISARYALLNVPLLAINSMDTIAYGDESLNKMKERAMAEGYKFPYLSDGSQTVAKVFSAEKTPHAFVLWKENNEWIVKYNGAIDDNGAESDSVKNPYLVNAVDQLLAGKQVSNPETRSIGCYIHYRK